MYGGSLVHPQSQPYYYSQYAAALLSHEKRIQRGKVTGLEFVGTAFAQGSAIEVLVSQLKE